MTRRRLRAAAALAILGLTGCVAPAVLPSPSDDAWVVVVFADTEERFDLALFDSLLETEVAADEALRVAGLGRIEGNEIGDHGYEIYFIGSDSAAMWDIIEPVFDNGPAPWTRVELRDGFDDPTPVIVGPESAPYGT